MTSKPITEVTLVLQTSSGNVAYDRGRKTWVAQDGSEWEFGRRRPTDLKRDGAVASITTKRKYPGRAQQLLDALLDAPFHRVRQVNWKYGQLRGVSLALRAEIKSLGASETGIIQDGGVCTLSANLVQPSPNWLRARASRGGAIRQPRRHPHRRLLELLRDDISAGSRATRCVPAPPGFLVEDALLAFASELESTGWKWLAVSASQVDEGSTFKSRIVSEFRTNLGIATDLSFDSLSTFLYRDGRPVLLVIWDFDLLLHDIGVSSQRSILLRAVTELWCPAVVTSLRQLDLWARSEDWGSNVDFGDVDVQLCDDWDEYARSFALSDADRERFSRGACKHPKIFECMIRGGNLERDRQKAAEDIWRRLPDYRDSLAKIAAGDIGSIPRRHQEDLLWSHVARKQSSQLVPWDPGWSQYWPPRREDPE